MTNLPQSFDLDSTSPQNLTDLTLVLKGYMSNADKAKLVRFNSTLVRLKGYMSNADKAKLVRFNSTLVRLKAFLPLPV